MADPRPLSEYLPYRFPNGEVVQRFAKECPQCNRLIHADKMNGMIAEGRGQILILAQVECPFCEAEFGVCCTVNAQKHVKRLSVWLAFFFLLIRRYHEIEPFSNEPIRLSPEGQEALQATPLQPTQPFFTEPTRVAPEILGRFLEHTIPAWVELNRQRYTFVRTQPSGMACSLAKTEIMLKPGLIYRQSTMPAVPPTPSPTPLV